MAFQKEGMGQGLSGRLGGSVYRRSGGDTIVASAPERVNPDTPLQREARARMDRTLALWQALPLDAMVRWRAYAQASSPPPLAFGGERGSRRASGYAVFRGLAAKYLQLHRGRDAPTEPPEGAFFGDGIVVGSAGATGGVAFAASGRNSDGIVTELLLQRLPARHRLPKARDYRTARFVAFAGEPVTVEAPPGAYACAMRFVRAATGQATAMAPLGTVEVP